MKHYSILVCLLLCATAWAADPTATNYTFDDCRGSLSPYPTIESIQAYPDSLTPVYISHIGRHGSRFPASSMHAAALLEFLNRADSAAILTGTGKRLKAVTEYVISTSEGRWGALDSLGMAEMRGIASRMYMAYPEVFENGNIKAVSSYSPRCLMSMMSFVHQIDRLNNKVEIATFTGRSNSDLLRPFDTDEDYADYRKSGRWSQPYDAFMERFLPLTALQKCVKSLDIEDSDARELALAEYYVLAGLDAMGLDADLSEFFTKDEINSLWAAFNLRQYLQRAGSTISTVPADIASPLLLDIISNTEDFINGKNAYNINLRFAHAETLFPLLSLMRVPGAYYMTNYFDTVRLHWCDFKITPMAANLQMVLYKTAKGDYYARFDLNEKPVSLFPDGKIYAPWTDVKELLQKYVPMYYQF